MTEKVDQKKDYKKAMKKITADIRMKAQSSKFKLFQEVKIYEKIIVFYFIFCYSKWLHPHDFLWGRQ
jgi:Na+/H+-translocating membrane pyrophosphatase